MTDAVPADQSGLEEALDVELDAGLLRRALTHRSFAYEHGGLPHNERLEFLGDAVLGIVVTDTLYRSHPDLAEGKLAKLRASVVNMRALAGVARGIGPDGLGAYLLLGRGEEGTGGRDKLSILADTLEAVLGCIYVDRGLDVATRVVHTLFDGLLDDAASAGAGLDWKTSLQELTAEQGLGVPEYVMTSSGPDHEKTFTAQAHIAGELFSPSTGRSKKEAEQQAAETAWRAISARVGGGDLPGVTRPDASSPTDAPATDGPAAALDGRT
ncbi:ribonuclease III [uncultured Jatrophihabitans sp.]|uniref:ribonuclease III n=1 Tax=uncultured Jatrophihabitans sp. TaxID=1610747 RepID=UPI0035CBE3BC